MQSALPHAASRRQHRPPCSSAADAPTALRVRLSNSTSFFSISTNIFNQALDGWCHLGPDNRFRVGRALSNPNCKSGPFRTIFRVLFGKSGPFRLFLRVQRAFASPNGPKSLFETSFGPTQIDIHISAPSGWTSIRQYHSLPAPMYSVLLCNGSGIWRLAPLIELFWLHSTHGGQHLRSDDQRKAIGDHLWL